MSATRSQSPELGIQSSDSALNVVHLSSPASKKASKPKPKKQVARMSTGGQPPLKRKLEQQAAARRAASISTVPKPLKKHIHYNSRLDPQYQWPAKKIASHPPPKRSELSTDKTV
ncbi:hypothetical protein P7C70_g1504, partial [Phenoliferia sp. Uapishka_3]